MAPGRVRPPLGCAVDCVPGGEARVEGEGVKLGLAQHVLVRDRVRGRVGVGVGVGVRVRVRVGVKVRVG